MEELKEWLKPQLRPCLIVSHDSMEELKEWLKQIAQIGQTIVDDSMEELKEWLKLRWLRFFNFRILAWKSLKSG